MNTLLSATETTRLIHSGAALALAGSARALAKLPTGNWIGGTSHYFVGPHGGVKSDEQIFVTELSHLGKVTFARYAAKEVDQIGTDAPKNGFSFVIIPAASASLKAFAQRGYSDDLFMKPVVGWVAGVDLAEVNTSHAKIFLGKDLTCQEDGIAVAHVELDEEKLASISIINPFDARDEYQIRFDTVGFSAVHCTVNGKQEKLADFLIKHGCGDGRLPLIGDFSGAAINVSIQAVNEVSGQVQFYAPVFPGVDYRLAKPMADVSERLSKEIGNRSIHRVAFSCNCILNYLYGDLEGKPTGDLVGPVTFGEIGYQLLNQTLVMLDIV